MIYGMGGGIVLVPSLFLYLHHFLGYDETISMKIAIGTSFLNMLVSTLLVAYRYYKKQSIMWAIVAQCSPFLVMGTLLGLVLAHQVSGPFLKEVFIIFLSFIACNTFFNKSFQKERKLSDFTPPSKHHFSIAAFIVGALSILLGVGGSTIIVPYLRYYKMPMLQATAITASLAPITALIGTLGYLWSGMHASTLPPHSLGYINLPIFIGVQAGSLLGIALGEKINHQLSDRKRAHGYLVLLIAMLILMII